MKFTVGDNILLKRTGEEGFVVAILPDGMMEVAVHGVHFPVYIDEVDHPYLKWFTEKKKAIKKVVQEIPVEKVKNRQAKLAQGIYLSFMPDYLPDIMEDIISQVRIYLLNETPTPIHFLYEARDAAGRIIFTHKASLHAFGHLYLHPLSLEEMNGQPRFHWLIGDDAATIFSSDNKGVVKIKPARLFEHFVTIQQNNEPSFSYLLADDVQGIVKVKEVPLPLPELHHATPVPAIPAWEPCPVLDLHAEKLVADAKALSSAEILQLQSETLHYHLDMAIAYRQDRMIIIHGVGKGILRQLVQDILKEKAGVKTFHNGWQGQYGFGATEVLFD